MICALNLAPCGTGTEKSLFESIESAKLLLAHGADPTVITNEGWTALHCLALQADHDHDGTVVSLTRELVEPGADPTARAPLLSPLRLYKGWAPRLAWGQRLERIMAAPAEASWFVKPGLPPLMWAAENGALGAIKGLLALQDHSVLVSDGENGQYAARMVMESVGRSEEKIYARLSCRRSWRLVLAYESLFLIHDKEESSSLHCIAEVTEQGVLRV